MSAPAASAAPAPPTPRSHGGHDPLPPGPRLPPAAQTVRWIREPVRFLADCQARFGDTFTIRLLFGEGTWVVVTHPDDVRTVFTGDPAVFHAGEANGVLEPIVGRHSLLLLDDAPHLRHRRLMLPPFHGERLRRYRTLMAQTVERELAHWPAGRPVPAFGHTQAITLEVIMRAVFGVEEGARLDRLRSALKEMLDWTTRPSRFVLLALAGPQRARSSRRLGFRGTMEPVSALLMAEIAERRAAGADPERDDVLSLLLAAHDEDGVGLSDRELHDELLTLLVAGHETTATSLAWALERLAHHPDVLARLEAEVDAGEEEYAEAVVRETLRLRPVLPVVLRRLTATAEVAGLRLPPGTAVAPCIHLLHRRPDVYPDPEAFRPERFLDTSPGTYTWIPFGGGLRRCIGATFAQFEMTVVLTALLRARRLRPAGGPDERVTRRAITFTPDAGGCVALDAR